MRGQRLTSFQCPSINLFSPAQSDALAVAAEVLHRHRIEGEEIGGITTPPRPLRTWRCLGAERYVVGSGLIILKNLSVQIIKSRPPKISSNESQRPEPQSNPPRPNPLMPAPYRQKPATPPNAKPKPDLCLQDMKGGAGRTIRIYI